jgi:hypothetical protein
MQAYSSWGVVQPSRRSLALDPRRLYSGPTSGLRLSLLDDGRGRLHGPLRDGVACFPGGTFATIQRPAFQHIDTDKRAIVVAARFSCPTAIRHNGEW